MKKSLLIISTLFFFGCENATHNPQEINPKEPTNKKLQIVTSFYPLAFMTQEIVGEKANVINLAGNQDAHDYQLSPQDMVKLNQADLVVFQGAQLEPWAEDLIPQLQNKKIKTLEVTHNLNLSEIKEPHEHEEHEKEASEHSHHHGKFDPHTWLDPVLAQDMITEITKSLIAIDHDSKEIYKNNANQLKNKFQKLEQDFQKQLSQCERDEVIISHDAFGYIAKRFRPADRTFAPDGLRHRLEGVARFVPQDSTFALFHREEELVDRVVQFEE